MSRSYAAVEIVNELAIDSNNAYLGRPPQSAETDVSLLRCNRARSSKCNKQYAIQEMLSGDVSKSQASLSICERAGIPNLIVAFCRSDGSEVDYFMECVRWQTSDGHPHWFTDSFRAHQNSEVDYFMECVRWQTSDGHPHRFTDSFRATKNSEVDYFVECGRR